MEVNVQMNMTNVKKWQCLIYDCIFSIHYEKKGYNLKETTAVKPTSCDWGFGLWAVVLI